MTITDLRNASSTLRGGSRAKAMGRRAGVTYLALILTSVAGYATMTRLLAGDPRTVLERLTVSHNVFSSAFAAMAVGFLCWALLAYQLYRLTSPSGRVLAALMVIFTIAGVAMNLTALSRLLPLVVSSVATDAPAVATLVKGYNRVLLLAQLFSGAWLFPYGWLVIRSRIAPPLLGACLFIGGFGYAGVFATAFAPALDQMLIYRAISALFGIAAIAGEFGMCLWLLIKGAREPYVSQAA